MSRTAGRPAAADLLRCAHSMAAPGSPVVRTASPSRRRGVSTWALCWVVLSGCDKTHAPDLPPAEVYVPPAQVHGQWRGEVGGVEGTLRVDDLAGNHYRGMFVASGISRRYVLNMEQVGAPGPDGLVAPSNLVRFRWQDGRGDRGEGWLLVNREGSALTGSFGRGDGMTSGAGEWTFVRSGAADGEDSAPPPDDEPQRRRGPPDEPPATTSP